MRRAVLLGRELDPTLFPESDMSKAATSVVVFGGYLVILGIGLIVAPALVLAPFGFAAPTEVWIHVLGVVVTTLGVYYVQMARANVVPFFHATVLLRPVVFVAFVAFVLIGWAPVPLALFGAVDAAGAAWTWWALRGDAA